MVDGTVAPPVELDQVPVVVDKGDKVQVGVGFEGGSLHIGGAPGRPAKQGVSQSVGQSVSQTEEKKEVTSGREGGRERRRGGGFFSRVPPNQPQPTRQHGARDWGEWCFDPARQRQRRRARVGENGIQILKKRLTAV